MRPETHTSCERGEAAGGWDELYRTGELGQDAEQPCEELVRVIEEGWISPCRVLELGCGAGGNAAYLASRGFEVTAIDVSICAIEKAVALADKKRVRIRFLWDDVANLQHDLGLPFDFILDRGCYEHIRLVNLVGYLSTLRCYTALGSQFLCLVGRGDPNLDGECKPEFCMPAPVVKKSELMAELGSVFRINWIEECRFDVGLDPAPLGWSCLMNRFEW